MPAHSENYPWPAYYGNYNFFVNRIREHSKVADVEATDDFGVYNIRLENGRSLRVFICECYCFGVAEYHEVIEKLGKFDAFIISSNWCSYTDDLKLTLRDEKVGLFKIGEFMGAINKHQFWLYLTKYDHEQYESNGWLD